MNYRPEIDGLRTIAILPVIFFHLGYDFISGGYLGVDVFFVISGFLITTILTTKILDGNFNIFEFWKRRIRRLFPALLVVALLFLIIFPFIGFKPNIIALSTDIFPAIFSYFNIYALLNLGDYWGGAAEKSYFLHSWSLSLEEQFYLIYPFFLFIIYKYLKNFIISLFIITLLSTTIYLYFINTQKTYAFYLLPNRVWEFGIGGIVSLLKDRVFIKNSFYKNLILSIALILILASYFIPTLFNNTNGFGAFISVLGVVIILGLCNRRDFLGKLLSLKPIVYIGKISYSLYLCHWPIILIFGGLIFKFSSYNKHYVTIFIFIFIFLISVVLYHLIENKTRDSKHTLKLVVVLIISIVSLSIYYRSDNFNIYYNSKYNQVKYYLKYYDISPSPINMEKHIGLTHNVFMPNRNQIYKKAFKEEGIITMVDQKKPELMLFGDSHGVMWARLLDEICDSLKISRSFYTSNASKPFFDIKNIKIQKGNYHFTQDERCEYAKSVVKNIEKWKPKIFLIACRYDEFNQEDKEKLNDLLDYLNSKSIKVILFNQPPMIDFIGGNNASQYFTFLGINPVKGFNYLKITNNETTNKGNYYLEKLKSNYKNIDIYDVYSKMTRDKKMVVSNYRELFYFDDDHLSFAGTKFHKNNIMKLLKSKCVF